MLIKNFDGLTSRGECKAKKLALGILEDGLKRADPKTAVKKALTLQDDSLFVNELMFPLRDKLIVVGAGKASGRMSEAVEEVLGPRVSSGVVVVRRGTARRYSTRRIRLVEGDHPIPSEASVKGAEEVVDAVRGLGGQDLVLCLISGGGSALLALPAEDISLQDKRVTTELLLKSGATINEINVVRKHLSAIKGGQLARAAYPARLAALIVSDVVGDPMGFIASGPTVPDTSTFVESVAVLKRYDLWREVPESVLARLGAGSEGRIQETPKPGDRIFGRAHSFIVASNRLSLEAMAEKAVKLGLHPLVLTSFMEGEARHVGRFISSIIREVCRHDKPVSRPAAIIVGGETTVTVVGDGRGGRNQELALGAALGIDGLKGTALVSVGSDGIDGVCDAAGAVVDGTTIRRAQEENMDPFEFLKNNDTYGFFSALKDCVFTGPTDTNVNDLAAAVVLGP